MAKLDKIHAVMALLLQKKLFLQKRSMYEEKNLPNYRSVKR